MKPEQTENWVLHDVADHPFAIGSRYGRVCYSLEQAKELRTWLDAAINYLEPSEPPPAKSETYFNFAKALNDCGGDIFEAQGRLNTFIDQLSKKPGV